MEEIINSLQPYYNDEPLGLLSTDLALRQQRLAKLILDLKNLTAEDINQIKRINPSYTSLKNSQYSMY